MRAAVITVGDELLAGDTVNTNAAWLGRQLADQGARVERMTVVPDRVADIARAVNEARAEFDAVVVTGGLGPTHDDVTVDGVAAALGETVEAHPDAEAWFEDHRRYSHDDLVAGTTALPRGARMLPNEVGVAPGAVVEGDDGVPVYVLPGVPDEMKAMFSQVAEEFDGVRLSRAVVETGEPESSLVGHFAALRERFDVSVGSYPGENGVRVKLQAEDPAEVEAAEAWLRERIEA